MPARTGRELRDQSPDGDDTGRPIYQVHLFVVGAGGRDVVTVKVPGEPKGIGEFTPMKLAELVATTWTMGDRSPVGNRGALAIIRLLVPVWR